ncbi:MAG: hypothetical protein H6672_21975 [Anaerolineaceae bacterium]|nr:hypothetical protein [Anaerolineaceae bacterium]
MLQDEPQETALMWGYVDDVFYRYDFLCEENCSLDLLTDPEEEPVHYALPSGGRFTVRSRISDNRLLLIDRTGEGYIIYPDKAPLMLGFFSVALIPGISPNGNWALLQDQAGNPEHYIIWDLQEERIMKSLSAEEFGTLRYGIFSPNGQLWSFFTRGATIIVDKTGQAIDLPATEERRMYFGFLDDGSLLYYTISSFDDSPGIYRLNPTSGDSVLVLPGDYRPVPPRSR